jgi:hypothetical protein
MMELPVRQDVLIKLHGWPVSVFVRGRDQIAGEVRHD